MLVGDGGGGYGFEVPEGDPGALRQAATSWQTLGTALGHVKQTVTTASERALSAGGWTGDAASAFTGRAENLVKVIADAIEAAATARGSLDALASELEHAQQVTKTALTECSDAERAYAAKTVAAEQAGQDATTKTQQAATATHPATASELSRQASSSRQEQQLASDAAGRAQDDLTAAETRGQNAVTAYDQAAAQIVARLTAAAGELVPAADDGDWREAVLEWVGHALDFSGAGAVAVSKSYSAVFTQGVTQMDSELNQYLGSDAVLSADPEGPLPDFTPTARSLFPQVENHASWADSGTTNFLTSGLDEDAHPVLGKVPYVAWALTGLDVAHNLADGENPAEAVGVPVANLAVGTGVAEVSSSAVAAGAGMLAGDGTLALAGSTLIPGVGEVVIAGALTVGATIAIDKGAGWVWDHGGEQVAGDAWHDVTHPVSTIKHVAHDLNPLNW